MMMMLLCMTGRVWNGILFLTEIFSWPSELFFKILMPQLKIIEIFHTPVSLVVEAIENFTQDQFKPLKLQFMYLPHGILFCKGLPGILHPSPCMDIKWNSPMTIGLCIVQLRLWGHFHLVQGRALVGTRGQSLQKTLEILHFMVPKIAQKTTVCVSFSPMFLTQIHRKIYCAMYPR